MMSAWRRNIEFGDHRLFAFGGDRLDRLFIFLDPRAAKRGVTLEADAGDENALLLEGAQHPDDAFALSPAESRLWIFISPLYHTTQGNHLASSLIQSSLHLLFPQYRKTMKRNGHIPGRTLIHNTRTRATLLGEVSALRRGTDPPLNHLRKLYHILSFRVLPDFYRGDVDITGPCQVSVINIGTPEKDRVVQLLPIGLTKIRRAIKNACGAAIEDNDNAMVVNDPDRL